LDNSYKLTIKSSDGLSKSYKLADIGLSIDNQKTIKTIHKKKLSPLTYLTWWRVVPISVGLTENTQKLNSFISLSINTTAIQATDANLSLVNGAVVLAAGSNGKSYSLDNATATVLKHVGSLSAQPIMVTAKTITPRISSTQLKTAVDSINATIEQPVSIIIAGHTITPSSSDIFAWLQIVPNNLKNNVIVKVDSSKILSYLNSVSAKYNYAPRTQTVVARSDGSTSVLAAGADGLKVTDNTAAATQIAQNLLNDKGIKFTLATAVVPFSSVDATTYPKWIEVNLTDKKLYAYEQNNLVKTFLVSAGAPATPTVTGQYKIYSKVATQDMWGYNANGTMYNQPNVQWINYFYGSYAIHGNYWRPLSWFGSVNSSHGCVGLTNDDAEWIYDWAPIGTVVVTHY
jgi:lipoprotein-anchoring transpeptidase ErfK/SrfK